MLFKRKPIRLFELPEPKRFRTTKLDILVVTVVLIVFLWGFLLDSFKPLFNENGEPIVIMTARGPRTQIRMNLQFFIAPIVFCYEILVIVMLDGKLKGRELPWYIYYLNLKVMAINKIREGIDEYKVWRKLKNV